MFSSKRPLRIGISTCPNDTFAFDRILRGEVAFDFPHQIELLDIQQLNDSFAHARFDVAKTSFAMATRLSDYAVLRSGSAIGFGVGPLLLTNDPRLTHASPNHGLGTQHHVLCPGRDTTATQLLRWFYPQVTRIEYVRFSEIMPRLIDGSADAGVCIHEGRFTYEKQGLHRIEDLGERWETESGLPLPLGGLVIHRAIDGATAEHIDQTVRQSIRAALRDPDTALPTMRRFAQEFDDAVLMHHVDLYVNPWTVDVASTRDGSATNQRPALDALRHFFDRAGDEPFRVSPTI